MKLIYAKNPVWANRSKTMIDLTVKFEEINEELPFTANQNDVEVQGRDIYARAVAGEFGVVGSFNPISPTVNGVEETIRAERNHRLQTEVDPIVSNPLRWADLTPEQQQAIANYRRALLDMTNNPSFPWYDQVVLETDWGFQVDITKAPFPTSPN